MSNELMEKVDIEALLLLAEEKKYRLLLNTLLELNEVDIASFIEELDAERTVVVFRMLPKAIATDVFAELPVEKQTYIINSITDQELSEIVEELFVDDAVDMLEELPAVFHESALIERIHGFIKGWNIPRMNDDLKICGWALNSEYFCSILHELREESVYRAVVDGLVAVPEGADTRDTEAVKRIATAYLKLLFPHVRDAADITAMDFNRYCLRRACNMRAAIKMQLGILDEEYAGKDIPHFRIHGARGNAI